MTLVGEPPLRVSRAEHLATHASERARILEVVEHAAVLLAVLMWGIHATHADGGTTTRALLETSVATTPALVLTRPWRRLSATALIAAAGLALAAVAVCVLSPTGWTGAATAASYALAAGLAVVAMAWVAGDGRLARRRRPAALALVVMCIGLEQMCQGLLEWWGGGDPGRAMSGTLGWRNQFAVFLVPAVLLGLAAAVSRLRPLERAGWVVAPLGVACVVFSSSRATLGILVVAWATVGVTACVAAEDRLSAFRRLVGVSVVAAALTLLLPGPPLFDHRSSPFAATSERVAAGESVSANTGYRTQFWQEAAQVALHHPLVGGGYGSLTTAGVEFVPGTFAISSQAHSGFLQAFSDGGLLLGGPVAAASGLLLAGAVRSVRRRRGDRALPVAGAVSLVALLAHSAGDFDWSRPVVLVLPGLMAGVCGLGRRRAEGVGARPWRVAAVIAILVVPIAGTAIRVHADTALSRATTAADLVRLTRATFPDDRAGRALIARADLTGAEARAALSATAAPATVDLRLALQRAVLQIRLGIDGGDVDRAWSRGLTQARRRPYLAAALAPLAHALGHDAQLRGLLERDLVAANAAQDVQQALDLVEAEQLLAPS